MIGKIILQVIWMVWCLSISTAVAKNSSLITEYDLNLKINYHIFGIEPHSTILPLRYTTLKPQIHPKHNVHNIGRHEVLAKTQFGNLLTWTGDVSSARVLPNVRVTLENHGRPYIRTGLVVRNERAFRAIVYVTGGNRVIPNRPLPGFDRDKVLRKAFMYGAKSIPYVGGGLKALLNKFWPSNLPNLWTQIRTPINELLDPSVQLTITNVLTHKFNYLKGRIELLLNETQKKKHHSSSAHYMNLSQELEGLEEYFKFNNLVANHEWTNTVVLGLFTTTVSMKVNFYEIGIANPRLFKLSSRQVQLVKNYLKNTLHGPKGAITYIKNLHTLQVERCYKTCYAGGLFDRMVNIRSHIALQGLEAIPLWVDAEKHPGSKKQPYVDVISYSEFFGRPTSNLYSVVIPVNMLPPLTPDLKADGTRRRLLSIDVFIWRLNGTSQAKVGGAKLTFEGNRIHTMGTTTSEIQRLNLNGAKITNLRVFGRGSVDKFVFTLNDGRVLSHGSANHNRYVDFNLLNHHIASLFISNDAPSLGGQAANVAVCYRLNDFPRS